MGVASADGVTVNSVGGSGVIMDIDSDGEVFVDTEFVGDKETGAPETDAVALGLTSPMSGEGSYVMSGIIGAE